MTVDKEFLLPADLSGRNVMEERIMSGNEEIEKTVLGKSILGREIPVYRIGKGKRPVVFVAAHHALEAIGTNLLYLFLRVLSDEEEYRRLGVGILRSALLSSFSLYLIPCLNPDGAELVSGGAINSPLRERQLRMSGGDFSTWQANARGVDLNHNYDAYFYEYKRLEREKGIVPGATLYSGEYPESEPETRALASFIRALMPTLTVSLHTQGEEIYFSERGRRLALALAERTGYRPSRAEGTAAYGGLTDYLERMKLAALTVEMGKGKNPLPNSLLPLLAERLLPAFAALPTLL